MLHTGAEASFLLLFYCGIGFDTGEKTFKRDIRAFIMERIDYTSEAFNLIWAQILLHFHDILICEPVILRKCSEQE